MADFEKMYYTLFNQITDTIEMLQKIQQETEEMYCQAEDDGRTRRFAPTEDVS